MRGRVLARGLAPVRVCPDDVRVLARGKSAIRVTGMSVREKFLALNEVPAAEVGVGVSWIVGKRTASATRVALSTPTSWYPLAIERRISHFYTADWFIRGQN